MALRLFPNATRLANTNELSQEQWLAARQNTIGGSDISAIIGVNPWSSALQLYLEKKELKERKPTSYAMRRGQVMENAVAELFKEETGLKIEKVNAILGAKSNPRHTANLDRIIVHGPKADEWEILEIKTATQHMISKWRNEAPLYYQAQVHWYMYITGIHKARLVCDLGDELVQYTIVYDQEIIDVMIQHANNFLNQLDSNIMPEVQANDGGIIGQILAVASQDEAADLSAHKDKVEKILEIKEQEKSLETERKELENQVKVTLGAAKKGLIDGAVVVKASSYSQSRLDSDLAKKYLEEMGKLEECIKTSTINKWVFG